jgi:CheY-like chemotaxis protein
MSGSILIVEDNRELREVMTAFLTMEGYETTTAENGAQALDRLRHAAQLPDVILLDLQMPVMGGKAFMEALPEAGIAGAADIPIVIITASRLHLGSAHTLRKPFEIADLLEAVEPYVK